MTKRITKAPAPAPAAAPSPVKGFASRIVRTGTMRARDVKANPLNFRDHPQSQRMAVKAVLDQLGWIDNVIINETTGNMLNGHLRVDIASERDEEVPVVWVKLTEAEERVALAAIDPTAAMAVTNEEMLATLLSETTFDSEHLRAMLDSLMLDVSTDAPKPVDLGPGMTSSGKTARQLGDRQAQIRPVLYASEVGILEEAIRRTGIANRGKALIAVCEFFIEADQVARP